MVRREKERPRRVFALVRLRPSHLEAIVRWISGGSKAIEDEDIQKMEERLHTAFRSQYRPLWHSGETDTFVMTVNRDPVFCMSLLCMVEMNGLLQSPRIEAHMYLLCRHAVRRNDRLLQLAWQAATVHAFLKMGFSRIQTAVDADAEGENQALRMLGYKWTESVNDTTGKMNVYVCQKEDLQMMM